MADLNVHCSKCGDIEELPLAFAPTRFTISGEYLDVDCDLCVNEGPPA